MPESTTSGAGGVGREKGKVEFINLEEDTDTGDSEFEPPEGGGAQDDDSIAAEEDVADEEEVNGLMRVRTYFPSHPSFSSSVFLFLLSN